MSNTQSGGATVGGNVGAGRDVVGRDQNEQTYSGSAQVNLALDRDEWIVAQFSFITNQLTQVSEKLKKLDQIDEALVGNRLYGERGLVEDVRRLWAVVIAIVIFLALLGVVEVAQWWLLWHLWRLM